MLKLIAKMRKTVTGLEMQASTEWSSYRDALPYADEEHERKKQQFRSLLAQVPTGALAWDVGANDGTFSDILAERFDRVLALDSDSGAAEQNYRRHVGTELGMRVSPAVMDIADPPAGRGWRNHERLSLSQRTRPDVSAWLAVVHHLSITGGVPLPLVADAIESASRHAIVEWVDNADPQVELLLSGFQEGDRTYSESVFRNAVESSAEILAEAEISPTRRLMLIRAR